MAGVRKPSKEVLARPAALPSNRALGPSPCQREMLGRGDVTDQGTTASNLQNATVKSLFSDGFVYFLPWLVTWLWLVDEVARWVKSRADIVHLSLEIAGSRLYSHVATPDLAGRP